MDFPNNFSLRSRFPGVVPEVQIEESCMYTMTPDENPIIDTLPSAPNIVIGAGFSGDFIEII
jgi:sarcosine oxidase / L-pipecolate oxidase